MLLTASRQGSVSKEGADAQKIVLLAEGTTLNKLCKIIVLSCF